MSLTSFNSRLIVSLLITTGSDFFEEELDVDEDVDADVDEDVDEDVDADVDVDVEDDVPIKSNRLMSDMNPE